MPSKYTICQVLHSLNVGGAEVLAARIAKQLDGEFHFVFACLDEIGVLGDELRAQGFKVELLHRQPGLDMGCARRLASLARREQVGVLHAHQYTPFAYSLLGGVVRRRPPVLFNEHGRFHPDHRNSRRVWFNRIMLRRRDRVVAVGKSVGRALIDNEGISAQRIQVIHNGIKLPDRTQLDIKAGVRNEFGVAPREFVIAQVARLDRIKDHATAVRTMARVLHQRPRTQLWIVGDGPERGNIEREIAHSCVSQQVRLLGERRDVARILVAADAFLLTSLSEGIPVTVIEAMGASLPVVGTDVGGMGEVVATGQTGLLVRAGADEDLAEAIVQLIDHPERRSKMGEAGRQRAESLFTEEQMHAAYAALYRQMMNWKNTTLPGKVDHERGIAGPAGIR